MQEMLRIRLQLFGRFAASIVEPAPRLVQIAGRHRRALLAYLAMRPGYEETRERLAALLWGESADKQARQNLRQALLLLREDFSPAGIDPLKIERDIVGLDPARVAVDAREFLALAESNDIADLERALALHSGEFLDGLDLDIEAFEEWKRAERARIAAAATAFGKLANLHDRAGNGPQAVRALEKLVTLDPLNEERQRSLLRLLARHRGRDAALAQAETFARKLRDELGATPEPATAAFIEEIRQRATSSEPPAASAPHRISSLSPAETALAASRRSTWLPQRAVLGWSAAAVVLLALTLGLLRASDRAERAAAGPTPAANIDEQSWRSPSILPGVAVDQAALARQGAHAVLVLPFAADAAGGVSVQALADRMTSDLVNDLSRVQGLRVISQQTSRLYRDRATDVAVIGAELGVRYVVEGRLQIQGSTVRINVGLTDTTTRLQVWSDRFEREQSERFAAQDEIVRSIARHLHVTVLTMEADRRAPISAGDPKVDDLIAKGWSEIIRIFEFGAASAAGQYFEEALKLQPTNGGAMLGLAGYHVAVVATFVVEDTRPHIEQAELLLARVLKLNPRTVMGNYYQGVLHKVRGDPHAALAFFTKCLEINPSFALAYANAGHTMSRIGRLQDGIEHVRYAIRLSPKDPNLGSWSLYAGEIELELGHDDAALEWLKRAVALNPRQPFNQAALAAIFALRGDKPNAAKHAAEVKAIAPWLTLDRMLERVIGLSEAGHRPGRLVEGLKLAFAPQG